MPTDDMIASDILLNEEPMSTEHRCRLCKSTDITPFLDFGDMPLAGGFIKEEDFASERKYPLNIFFCGNCTSVQALQSIPGDTLFRKYFYFSSVSQTLIEHFTALAEEYKERFIPAEGGFVVEIGSNDGVLLSPLKNLGVKALGVDPATNVAEQAKAKGLDVIAEYFTKELAAQIVSERGHAHVISASNVFAHIEDMDTVAEGIKELLDPEGVFVFEVHYLLDLLKSVQYDMMYHEHIYNHSLHALTNFLARFDMEVCEVRLTQIHAGSIRVYAKHKASRRPIDVSVADQMETEQAAGVDKLETYQQFAKRVAQSKVDLMELLHKAKAAGQRVVGYGAAGRATMIVNYCGITTDLLPYIVDASPAKRGFYMPGVHIPIDTEERMRQEQPEYALLFAWGYKPEVMAKEKEYVAKGGKFITPLPTVSVE